MQWQELFAETTAKADDPLAAPTALLVFAHPDDEVVALGARLSRFGGAHLVHVTDGAPLDELDSRAHGFASLAEYRKARQDELNCALSLAGVLGIRHSWLELPDQQAALHLALLARHVYRFLAEQEPEIVITHPYEGGHPDHDACAFGVHRALAQRKIWYERLPLIIEAAFYHAGPDGIETGRFLPGATDSQEIVCKLSPQESELREALFACFQTQKEVLSLFSRREERFRVAPEYDFSRPPHQPPVYYDSQPWGMTSRRFCQLAREATDSLEEELAGPCH